MNNSAVFEERNKIRVCAGSVRADSYGMPFALKAAGERLSGANRIVVSWVLCKTNKICYNKRKAFIIDQNALHIRSHPVNSVHIGKLYHILADMI